MGLVDWLRRVDSSLQALERVFLFAEGRCLVCCRFKCNYGDANWRQVHAVVRFQTPDARTPSVHTSVCTLAEFPYLLAAQKSENTILSVGENLAGERSFSPV